MVHCNYEVSSIFLKHDKHIQIMLILIIFLNGKVSNYL